MSGSKLELIRIRTSQGEDFPRNYDPCGKAPRSVIQKYSCEIISQYSGKPTTWTVQYDPISGWFNGYCGAEDWVDKTEFLRALRDIESIYKPKSYKLEFAAYEFSI